jgi:hypothetical protein
LSDIWKQLVMTKTANRPVEQIFRKQYLFIHQGVSNLFDIWTYVFYEISKLFRTQIFKTMHATKYAIKLFNLIYVNNNINTHLNCVK